LISNVAYKIKFFFFALFLLQASIVFCQVDSTKSVGFDSTKPRIAVDSLPRVDSPVVANKPKVDSVMLHHSPRKAAIRSALIPGWGQFYNKKYWKIPIVYGALGLSASVFIFNLQSYRDTRFAYTAKYNASQGDSSGWSSIKPELVPLDMNALRTYRDSYRRSIDYSALFFIILWGLNVVDATVDAHLIAFDVSPDLSFKAKFGPSEMAGTTGLSLVLALK